MANANSALTIQLLEWISNRPRTYAETLEAWHSTCPRLSIWEDACIEGLIDHDKLRDIVLPSAKGRELLQSRPRAATPTSSTTEGVQGPGLRLPY